MKRWVFILILLPLLASAEMKQLTVTGFKLVTNKGDFQTAPNELRVCHDVNLSRNGVGTLSPPLGSIKIFTFPEADSVIGLATMSFRDGTEQLIAAVDSTGVGYAKIYASVIDTDQFDLTGTQKDSTYVVCSTQAYIDFVDSTGDDDTLIFYDTFFVDNPSTDTIVIVDTVCCGSGDLTQWNDLNDTLVARINAEDTLTVYITAAVDHDTTYGWAEIVAGTNVDFRWGAARIVYDSTFDRDDKIWIVSKSIVPITPLFQVVTTYNLAGISPSLISDFWGVQFPTDFDQLNDKMYIVNGQQKGLIYNGDYTSPWPMHAPGEISLIPIADSTANNIDGEYRYLIRYSSDSTSFAGTLNGFLTPPVKIRQGKILLKNFPVPAHSDTTSTQINDTFAIQIFRTFANPGNITRSDTAYLHSTHTFLTITDSSAFDLTVQDSIADGSLGAAIGLVIASPDIDYSARTTKKYGAPLLADDSTGLPDNKNIFTGTGATTTGVAYMVTYVDSANGTESDSSRALLIERDGGGNEDQYIIGLPIANTDFQVYKNIYRANVFTSSWDTVSVLNIAYDTSLSQNADGTVDTIITWAGPQFPTFVPLEIGIDKVIDAGNYRLVAQVPNSQAFFHDSIPYDSLLLQPQKFVSHPPPSGLEQIFVHNGRLFGTKGSRLYNSRIGLLNQWELFDFTGFNLDDGDQITMGLPFRGGILIGKHFSAFNLPDVDARAIELAGVPGCVAPKSAIQANGANYYLSNRGIMALSEGAALLRYHNSELLSRPLSNFLKKTFDELSLCVAAYVPQTEQLWFCIGDTTYVYDYESDAWATSSLTFGGTTLWDTDTVQAFRPGRSLYYYPTGDSTIYKFGEGHKNPITGTYIFMSVESGPLFPDALKQQIFGFGIWAQPDSFYALVGVNFYSQGDTLMGDWILPPIDRRVSFMDMYNDPAIYYRFAIYGLLSGFPMRNSGIDRIDIFYDDVSEIFWE